MPKAILVTGANGQLGSELRELSNLNTDFIFTFISRDELDLSDSAAIQNWFVDKTFDVIINCAAYTAVDKAQAEPDLARAINSVAVETLARIAKAKNSALIHISTDYVFNGKNYQPYNETDLTDPQGIYGQTKFEGEQAMLAINPAKSVIIRTSWVYSKFGNNFVKTMLRLGKEREELGVIYDQVGTPTSARDLAEAILAIIRHPKLESVTDTEVYHFSNEGVCSWYDFAKAIFALSALTCRVKPIETKDYPTPASRPHYSLLNKAKIKNTFDLTIPYWKDSLADCLNSLTGTEHL
ncbi:dTDP-4-dehydrorhamnose reductase [Methylobacter sp. S3L5C]|uniref:dTDP-4-dehydrorhamnose reductase n=1 Tax=Methylobacter sp. S3L5C TaxID=2839024 RepID=UPI001FAC696C|nr:dTDP-4-dehydrorhamnose reductase [Methylobacter sp. S3L5C]UOA08285.1 dTDP-4-dehydrorhamnose reductase [Methylobacter sp. S3L5C]UOA10143.1 dTDP-4-dehydrorhamnose reductase [Methylobacter sp. S3L5C]